jgi:hypothetical protein
MKKSNSSCEFLDEWVKAVNQHGGFGTWQWAVSRDPADVAGIINTILGCPPAVSS